jgi:hypothetical protein
MPLRAKRLAETPPFEGYQLEQGVSKKQATGARPLCDILKE